MPPSIPLSPLDPWIAAKIGEPGRPLSATALAAYQTARLQETLRLARARSPFYRRRLAAVPQDLASLRDLESLPFTTAQDIQDHGLQFLCVSQDEIQRVVTLDSSGTTGNPKRIYFTRDDQELTVDFFRVGMATLTDPDDRVLILLPGDRPGSVGDLLAIVLGRLGAQPDQARPGARCRRDAGSDAPGARRLPGRCTDAGARVGHLWRGGKAEECAADH